MKKILKNRYFLGTILTSIVYIIYLWIAKIAPFGDNSILKCDLYQQYVNFFCYLKQVLLNGKSIMMSWNLGLANNFYTTFVYYLASPLNLLVVFFNEKNMYVFIELLTYIKLVLIFNTMMLYISKVWNYKKIDSILFSLFYTFSSYVISYLFHIMWLDALYMLPIILIFVEEYIKGGKAYKITISTAYTLLVNYYMGFIVSFFAGVYFIARFIIENKINREFILKFVKKLSIFLLALVLAFGISMIVLLPSFMQLKGNISSTTQIFEFNKEKIELFSNVIFNNYNYMFTQKACLIFSSTFILVLIPLFYMNKSITQKEKIVMSLVIIFLLLPVVSPLLNKFFHCMTVPNCFNYRYSFVLIFTLILISFRAYQNKDKIKKLHFFISGMVFLILTLIEITLNEKGVLTTDGFIVSSSSIIISMITYILFFGVFAINCFSESVKLKNASTILLIVITIVDLTISIKSYQKSNIDPYFTVETVKQYDSVMEKILNKIECKETDRIIFVPDMYGSNMSMKYGYSNIGFFSSARNKETIQNMYKLGYNIQRADGLWITSYSGTWFNYSLAGVKYYITKEKLSDNEIYGFIYEDCIDEQYFVYKCVNSLPFGYYVSDNIETTNSNPFEIQNNILNDYGEKNQDKERYFYTIDNTTEVAKVNKNVYNKMLYSDTENKYIEKVEIEYEIQAKKDIDIYVYSDINLQIYENEKAKFQKYADLWSIESGVKQITHLNAGESYNFTLEVDKEKYNTDEIYLYAIDNEKATQKINKKTSNSFKIEEINSNGVVGKTRFENSGYLCLEIAYDDGWRAYVDGKQSPVQPLYGSYAGIKVPEGEHEVRIYYIPRYLKLSFLITIISLLVTIILIYKKKL